MSPPTLDELGYHFSGTQAQVHALSTHRTCAAVALIFRPASQGRAIRNSTSHGRAELELCFVQRARFPGDPWSGDMAFPGGKGEAKDANFHDIAARETFEETGLEIDESLLIGALPDVEVQPISKSRQLLLRPMLYYAPRNLGSFRLSHEIEDAYWIPLHHLWDPSRKTSVDWGRGGGDYPGISHGEQVIWGLTYRMLADCARVLNRPLPAGCT